MNIGEVSNGSGVSTKLIRYYESINLIRAAERTGSGYRVYGDVDVQTLRFIRRARTLGFTRVEAPEETANPADRPPRADLCKEPPRWVPATQVHGEGIFLRFDEAEIRTWEGRGAVRVGASHLADEELQ